MKTRKNRKLTEAQKVDQYLYLYNMDIHTRAKHNPQKNNFYKVFNTLQNATCCEKMNTEIKK